MWCASIVECSRSWCHKANFNIYLRYHAHKSNTNFWWKASYYLGQLRKLRIHVWIYNSCNYGFSILFLRLGHYCYRNSLQLDFHNCKLFWVGKRVPWQNPHMRTHLLVTFKFTFCHCYERRIVIGANKPTPYYLSIKFWSWKMLHNIIYISHQSSCFYIHILKVYKKQKRYHATNNIRNS